MSKISLSASMSSSLLSLQQTQRLMDTTQLRLSTGLKVNSAIENPSAFYSAASLNNRANDLSALLDSMGQAVQTVKAATEAIATGTKMLEQAQAVAGKALEKDSSIIAKVSTEQELLQAIASGKKGFIVIGADINLTNPIELKNGQSLVGDNYFADYSGANRKLSFDFNGKSGGAIFAADNSTVSNLDINFKSDSSVEKGGVINAQNAHNITFANLNIAVDTPNIANVSGNWFSAIYVEEQSDVTLKNNINIRTTGSKTFGLMAYRDSTINISKAIVNIQTQGLTGFASVLIGAGDSNNCALNVENSKINISSSAGGITNQIDSATTIKNSELNIISTQNGILNSNSGDKVFTISDSKLNIKSTNYGINNSNSIMRIERSAINIESLTAGAVYLGSGANFSSSLSIDGNSRLNLKTPGTNNVSQAAFRAAINATDGVFIELNIHKGAIININRNNILDKLWTFNNDYVQKWTSAAVNINDFSGNAVASAAEGAPNAAPFIPNISDMLQMTFNGQAETLTEEAHQFNSILHQYNQLILDGDYKGVNLLQSDNLNVIFNEDRSSKLEINGVDASSQGLALHQAGWGNKEDVLQSLSELQNGISQLRRLAGYFGNNYSIIQTREDFTKNLINTLTEGADKLILADMNEESANTLALQTRQQLALNALSLASRASQGVLSLF